MKKIIIFILMIVIIIIPKCIGIDNNSLEIKSYNVDIISSNDRYYIEETINYISNSNGKYNNISIWISNSAEEIKILFNENYIELISLGQNNYSINLPSSNFSKNTSINIKLQYFYDKSINEFRKYSTYNIDKLKVNFDKETIFSGHNISYKSNIIIPLYKLSEAPINVFIFAIIFLLMLFILLSAYYILRRQKNSKMKNISGESKELLSTKKILLMSLLKQLEKEFRAKKISDDTYNKLRDHYKQETVESMKKLEDMDSEII